MILQKMMLDAEIYVDRIADMRISDMNAVLQAVRQMVLMQQGERKMICICGHWNLHKYKRTSIFAMLFLTI